jgi:hypothetical protein
VSIHQIPRAGFIDGSLPGRERKVIEHELTRLPPVVFIGTMWEIIDHHLAVEDRVPELLAVGRFTDLLE